MASIGSISVLESTCYLCQDVNVIVASVDCCGMPLCQLCRVDLAQSLAKDSFCIGCGFRRSQIVDLLPCDQECQQEHKPIKIMRTILHKAQNTLMLEEDYYLNLAIRLTLARTQPGHLVNKLSQPLSYYQEATMKPFRHFITQIKQLLTNLAITKIELSQSKLDYLQNQLKLERSIDVVFWYRQGYQHPGQYYSDDLAELHIISHSYKAKFTGVVMTEQSQPSRYFQTTYVNGRRSGYHQVVEAKHIHLFQTYKGRLNGLAQTWTVLGDDLAEEALEREKFDQANRIFGMSRVRPQFYLYRQVSYQNGRKYGWEQVFLRARKDKDYRNILVKRRHWYRDRKHGLEETYYGDRDHQRHYYQYDELQLYPKLQSTQDDFSRCYQLSRDSNTVREETYSEPWGVADPVHRVCLVLQNRVGGDLNDPQRYLEQYYNKYGNIKLESVRYRQREYESGKWLTKTYQHTLARDVVNGRVDANHWLSCYFDYVVTDVLPGVPITPEVFSNRLVEVRRVCGQKGDRLEIETCRVERNFTLELYQNVTVTRILNLIAEAAKLDIKKRIRVISKTAVVKEDGTVVE